MNEVMELIRKRTSLRGYMDRQIEKEHLDILLEAAMRAPTAGNMMTYSILVIRDEKKKEALSHSCDEQPFIAKAPLVLVFLADYEKWYKYYSQNGVKEFCIEKSKVFEGPTEASLFLAAQDAVIAAQNVVIAAESLGIGSCYIGDIMEKYEYHKELFKLPQYVFPVAMLCLGYYPKGYDTAPRPRFNREYVVFDEEYRELSKEEIEKMFERETGYYNAMNKYGAKNYAQQHFIRKVSSDFSKEMARSIKEAIKNWSGKEL